MIIQPRKLSMVEHRNHMSRKNADLKKTLCFLSNVPPNDRNWMKFFGIHELWTLYGEINFSSRYLEWHCQKLYWFWWSYVGPNITKSVFVLTEEEEVGEKTHNVTTDANCFFGSTLNTKPLSIKLKKKAIA